MCVIEGVEVVEEEEDEEEVILPSDTCTSVDASDKRVDHCHV